MNQPTNLCHCLVATRNVNLRRLAWGFINMQEWRMSSFTYTNVSYLWEQWFLGITHRGKLKIKQKKFRLSCSGAAASTGGIWISESFEETDDSWRREEFMGWGGRSMGGVSELTRQPRWRSHLATSSKALSRVIFRCCWIWPSSSSSSPPSRMLHMH